MKIANADLRRVDDQIFIDVTAIANSGGWTNVNLTELLHVMPPQDGLQEIILHGVAPTGPATDEMTPFNLSIAIKPADWFLGVRIKNVPGDECWLLRQPTTGKEPIGENWFSTELMEIKDDKLLIHVKYGGGCKAHSFQLNWDGIVQESFPPRVNFVLSHNNHGDNCMALLMDTLQFDLSAIADFPSATTDLLIHTGGDVTRLRYEPAAALAQQQSTVHPLTVKRGTSSNFDFSEAFKNAIDQFPSSSNSVDVLSHYVVKQVGAEVGGFAGIQHLYVDVEG